MAETDLLKEILNEKTTPVKGDEDNLLSEILSEPVGGTYQPIRPDDKFGRPSGISVITNEPLKSYVPGAESGAGFGTLIKNVFVDDPKKQIEVYAQARGIPVSNYRIHNGEIIFRNKEGKWQRETGELPLSLLEKAAAQTANPAVIGGTVGAIFGGPKGAAAGAAAGELARQAIGGAMVGDFGPDTSLAGLPVSVGNVGNVIKESAIALASELPAVAFKAWIMGHRMAKTGLGAGAAALRVSNLTAKDHLKAEIMRNMAKQYNIDLPLHQAYDKASLENFWMYLRKHPATSDRIKDVEATLAKQGDEAVQGFLDSLRGGVVESPTELGTQASEAATKAIEGAKANRASAVAPIYDSAFQEAELSGGIDISPAIKQLDQLINSYNKGPAQKILQSIKQKLGTEEKVQIGKTRLAKGWTATAEEEKGVWSFRSFVKKIGGIAVDDPNYRGEIRDIAKGARWAPGVVSSRGKGGNWMDELLAKIKESGQWNGIIESEDDVLRALETNPTNSATWGRGSEARIQASQIEGAPTTEAGREWKEAFATRKQAEIPKSIFTPETDLRKIQKAMFEIDDIIEGTAYEAAQISPSSKNVLTRELMSLKTQLLEQIGKKAPSFLEANEKFANLSEPIDALKRSIIGELSRLQKDKTTAEASKMLFGIQQMPDPELVWRARASLEPQNPDLWKRLAGSYIEDVYNGVRINERDPLLAFGEFRRKLFGNSKQQQIMEAALGRDKFRQLNDLMTVLNRTTAGTKGQSMTAQFGEMGRAISPPSGSAMYETAMSPKRAAVEALLGRWNDALTMGRHMEMLDAMLSKDAVKKLSNLKQLTPGSQKLINGISEYLGMVAPVGEALKYGNTMPEEQ